MQYSLNYSGTRFFLLKIKITQSPNGFGLKLYGHAAGYLIRAIIFIQLVVSS